MKYEGTFVATFGLTFEKPGFPNDPEKINRLLEDIRIALSDGLLEGAVGRFKVEGVSQVNVICWRMKE